MSEGPRRLLDYDDGLNALLRGALDAERADDVDVARLARIGRRVSAAVSAGAATTPAHAAQAATPAVAAIPAATTATGTPTATKTWLASKGPFVFLAVAGIGGLAAMSLRAPSEPRSSARAPTTQAPEPPETMTAPTFASPPPSPEPPTMSPADFPNAPVVSPSAKATAKPASASGASDMEEIALLARAHDALHGDPGRSIVLCKEHERRWAAGHFVQEREAVAIEALVYLGRREEAERRWTSFRARYPSSSHRVHLESLLAAPPAQ